MSPPAFTPTGREDDLDAILNIINEATSFIYISVMDFQPVIKSNTSHPDKLVNFCLKYVCVVTLLDTGL